ncbi:MAG: glycosyltransferase family protein [Clostridia bacterium]|jgi:spore coat polysaccharide biosynthesis protein SpsF
MFNDKVKIGCIIQARQGSQRLPGKATIPIAGKPALQRVIERLRAAKCLDDVIVATTINEADDAIEALCSKLGCTCYRGSEEDVLQRVLDAATYLFVDVIVEITADCPLIDPSHIDTLVNMFFSGDYDHVSNIIERTFPRGYDIRVFSREALERVNKEVDNPVDRQHVSTWMYLNPKGKQNYKCLNWAAPPGQNRPDIEVTLDELEDLLLIRWIYGFEGQGYNLTLDCQTVINLLDTYPHMLDKVQKIKRKDYFEELSEYYNFRDELEKKVLNGTSTSEKEPVGILNTPKGAKKQDEQLRGIRGEQKHDESAYLMPREGVKILLNTAENMEILRSEKHDDKFQVYNPNGRTGQSKRRTGRPKTKV